ncbi:putative DNA modification/repair radical SAM protein [Lactonifactor longoviformis]|uniref:putative DNA modification/repair radical SAM protein n=1 Tax=Lactonifactor longoviformis TaxID=341220 RepID=UPI0036F236A0
MNTANQLTLQDKLTVLADAAKYDVACTSSGVDRRGQKGSLGNSCAAGICHSFASDGRCISLLKVLQSNECIYDCKYCPNRASNDKVRATFTPEELCTLTIEFYKRNYIEGLFLSSGVCKNPTYTMELMYRTLLLLRTSYHFNGYVHVKAIPGASRELLLQTGYLADRMSVNMELPTRESLKALAPNKSFSGILKPMEQIQSGITGYRLQIGKDPRMERSFSNRYLSNTIFQSGPAPRLETAATPSVSLPAGVQPVHHTGNKPAPFVPAGQSTQMIIGATPENDFQLLTATQHLYQQYDLKRVFFSAYVPLNEDSCLPSLDTAPPLLREHRLYQADWLLRYYGFHAEDLLSIEKPNFNILLDPKCDWALRHLELFPMEINRASYEDLLKIPGIGMKSASRIVQSRRQGMLDFEHLKRMGIVLKRAKYFITCKGRMMYRIPIQEDFLTRQLTGEDARTNWEIEHPQTYRQLSLFDDMNLTASPTVEDAAKSISGQF